MALTDKQIYDRVEKLKENIRKQEQKRQDRKLTRVVNKKYRLIKCLVCGSNYVGVRNRCPKCKYKNEELK